MPTSEEITEWLRENGIEPERVVPGSVQGHRTGQNGECRLLFVEHLGTEDDPGYEARAVVVQTPPWLRARPQVSAESHAIMAEHLQAWLRRQAV